MNLAGINSVVKDLIADALNAYQVVWNFQYNYLLPTLRQHLSTPIFYFIIFYFFVRIIIFCFKWYFSFKLNFHRVDTHRLNFNRLEPSPPFSVFYEDVTLSIYQPILSSICIPLQWCHSYTHQHTLQRYPNTKMFAKITRHRTRHANQRFTSKNVLFKWLFLPFLFLQHSKIVHARPRSNHALISSVTSPSCSRQNSYIQTILHNNIQSVSY